MIQQMIPSFIKSLQGDCLNSHGTNSAGTVVVAYLGWILGVPRQYAISVRWPRLFLWFSPCTFVILWYTLVYFGLFLDNSNRYTFSTFILCLTTWSNTLIFVITAWWIMSICFVIHRNRINLFFETYERTNVESARRADDWLSHCCCIHERGG